MGLFLRKGAASGSLNEVSLSIVFQRMTGLYCQNSNALRLLPIAPERQPEKMPSEAIVPASFHGSDAKAAMIGAAGEA